MTANLGQVHIHRIEKVSIRSARLIARRINRQPPVLTWRTLWKH